MTAPARPARADLAARIDKALALHARVDSVFGYGRAFCAHDHENYPCPTVRALTEDA